MKKFLFTLLILLATSFPSYGESINCGSGETYTTLAAAVSHINSSGDAINTITITSDLTEAAAVLTKDSTTIKCDTTLYTVTALDSAAAALTIQASGVVIDNVGFTDTGLDNGVTQGLVYVDLASMTYSGSAIIKNCAFTAAMSPIIKSNYKAGLAYDLDIVNTSLNFDLYIAAISYDSSGIFRLTNSYLVLTSNVTFAKALELDRFASGSTVVGNYFNGAGVNNIIVSSTSAITDSSVLIANNLFSNANLGATRVNTEINIGNGTTQVTVNIVGNLFFDNSTHTGLTSGIYVYPKCTANVYNNTFVNKAYGLNLSGADATTTIRLYNNLFYGSRVYDIYTNNTSLVQYTFYNNTFNTNSAKQCDNATVLAALQASTGYSMAVSAMSNATVPTTGLFLLPNSEDNKAVITGSTTLLTNNTYNSIIQLLPRNPVWKTAANTAYPTNTTGVSPVYPTLSAQIPRGAYYNQTLFYIKNKTGEEGNDNGSGLETDPWLTIAKINALTNQQAGDTYSFNKGDTWREQLTVPTSGTEGSPITYTSYGSGENPVIDGSDSVIGVAGDWTEGDGSTWTRALTTEPYQIYFNTTTKGVIDETPDAAAEWTWADNVLTVYATSVPSTFYSAVAASARQFCINTNQKDYITIDGIDTKRAGAVGAECPNIYVYGSDHVMVQNLTTSYGFQDGIEALDSTNTTITGNLCYSNTDEGIKIAGDSIRNSGSMIKQNKIYSNGTNGITTYESDDFTVCHNLIYSNTGRGIEVDQFSGGGIYNNTFNANTTGIWISAPNAEDSDAVTFKNNIISGSTSTYGINIETAGLSYFVSDYNNVSSANFGCINHTTSYTLANWQALGDGDPLPAGTDANSISADPLFVNASAGRFWVKANSPCKKAGLSIAGYNDRLMPTSSWPAGIKTKATQGKTIGAYAAQYSLFPALPIYMKKWD